MDQLLTTLWQDESGQDLAEYGLLLALITVALVTAVGLFSDEIINAFERATTALQGTGTSG